MAGDAKSEWVLRVLDVRTGGVQAGGAEGMAGPFDEAAFKRSFGDALASWRDASDSADGQLDRIRKALLETDDADLHRIAEFGLNGITGRRKVGLQAALLEVGGATGPALARSARKAAQAAEAYRGFLLSDPRVKACDGFPDLDTPIGPTLGQALGALSKVLTF